MTVPQPRPGQQHHTDVMTCDADELLAAVRTVRALYEYERKWADARNADERSKKAAHKRARHLRLAMQALKHIHAQATTHSERNG